MASVELPQTIPFQPVRVSVERYHMLTLAHSIKLTTAPEAPAVDNASNSPIALPQIIELVRLAT